MIKYLKKNWEHYKDRQINTWMVFFLCIYVVFVIKLVTIQEMDDSLFFAGYSIAVSLYILSRFVLAYFYDPKLPKLKRNYEPTVSFAVPSKDEEENIRETILKITRTNYPKGKFDIIVVNDGSEDDTLKEMIKAQKIAKKKGVPVEIIDWKKNRGKREGMTECIKKSKGEIIIFIDSDSFVDSNMTKELIKYFSDKRVAAVAGHGYVANADTNMLTKMQDVRYFVAFKAYKGAEALFGTVICCSGCCSAYRKKYVLEVLDNWRNQSFLGARCTYGDDRSLTNYLLRKKYLALFAPEAKAHTLVPDTFKKFMGQQLRWKKSWIRESLKAGRFMWKKNPIMSVSFYLGVILPLLAPIIVVRALVWLPYVTGSAPYLYIFGFFLMAVVYGLYYYIFNQDSRWVYGVLFATFCTIFLIWQMPWAILNLRDTRWGTR